MSGGGTVAGANGQLMSFQGLGSQAASFSDMSGGGTVAGANGQLMSFQGLGSQAASFLRGGWWLRSARLALTGATPAQLLTEEVTGGGSSLPDARTLGLISRAAFDQDDCCRIMQVLHKRLAKFDKKLWRESYKALIVVEHLLIHGPHGVADELRGDDVVVIGEMNTLQYIDEKGFNWGLTVKNKSEKVLKLLEDPLLLNEQRDQAQKVSREIQGFGSFNLTFASTSSKTDQHYTLPPFIARSNSHYESISTEESDTDDTSWRSELGPETDESSELFLAHEEGPKMRNVPESGFSRDVLHINNKKSEFKYWPAKDTPFLSDNVAVEESEPFLPRRKSKRVNDVEMADHPIGFDRQGRESSFLLLSS